MIQIKTFKENTPESKINTFLSSVIDPKILSTSPIIIQYEDGIERFIKSSNVYKGLPQKLEAKQDPSRYDFDAEGLLDFVGLFNIIAMFTDKIVFLLDTKPVAEFFIKKSRNRDRYNCVFGEESNVVDILSIGNKFKDFRNKQTGIDHLSLDFLNKSIEDFVEEYNYEKNTISCTQDSLKLKYNVF